jgi:hypothetical protein
MRFRCELGKGPRLYHGWGGWGLPPAVCEFVNQTPNRAALTDWYWTRNAERRGFKARSVIGGVFIKMLSDPATWQK